jgi:chaperone required for assembly of F1-ATPase
MPFRQSDATRSRVQAVVAALDDLRFTAVQAIAGLTGSLALALAMSHGRISAAETFEAALLEELYQKERWGDDPLAANRRAAIAADLAGVEFFLRLLPA